jgi:hypothetical protein
MLSVTYLRNSILRLVVLLWVVFYGVDALFKNCLCVVGREGRMSVLFLAEFVCKFQAVVICWVS